MPIRSEKQRAYMRAYRYKNKEARRLYLKAWVRNNAQRASAGCCSARAKQKGIPCDVKYLCSMPLPDVCPVFGTKISFKREKGKRDPSEVATFDRIVPSLGYVPGNVQILSEQANRMKTDATPAELVLFAKWINRIYGADHE